MIMKFYKHCGVHAPQVLMTFKQKKKKKIYQETKSAICIKEKNK